jgi:hypothetical protein
LGKENLGNYYDLYIQEGEYEIYSRYFAEGFIEEEGKEEDGCDGEGFDPEDFTPLTDGVLFYSLNIQVKNGLLDMTKLSKINDPIVNENNSSDEEIGTVNNKNVGFSNYTNVTIDGILYFEVPFNLLLTIIYLLLLLLLFIIKK